MKPQRLTIALAQICPVWLNREATLGKVVDFMSKASHRGADLVVFGEAMVPGYPFWVELTGGAKFDSVAQKEMFALYCQQAVDIEAGDLRPVCEMASRLKLAVYLGTIERPRDRGGMSLYCSMVFIDSSGQIKSVHRKLMPTYEERLVWSVGDGHGLVTHRLGSFTVGGLNCWENWMPLARSALYAQGENLHIAIWPGSQRNTQDLTPVLAKEGRSFCASVCGLLYGGDIPHEIPVREAMLTEAKKQDRSWLADGGSCLAGPDGNWIIPPQTKSEDVFTAELDLEFVQRERQNFDPSGHYSRPDVLQLTMNSQRQSCLTRQRQED